MEYNQKVVHTNKLQNGTSNDELLEENILKAFSFDQENLFVIFSRRNQQLSALLLIPYKPPHTAINFDTWIYLLNNITANTNIYSCTLPKKIGDFSIFQQNVISDNKLMKFQDLTLHLKQDEKYMIHQFKLQCIGFTPGTTQSHSLFQNIKEKLQEFQKQIEICYLQLMKINQETQYDLFDEIIQKLIVKLKKLEQIQF